MEASKTVASTPHGSPSNAVAADTTAIPVSKPRNIIYIKSFRLSAINWFHVASTYLPCVLYSCLAIVAAQIVQSLRGLDAETWSHAWVVTKLFLWEHVWIILPACILTILWLSQRISPPVYLVDFATFKPPADWRVSREDILEVHRLMGIYSDESLEFLERILAKGATGEATHWPPNALRLLRSGKVGPMDTSIAAAREEAEAVIFGAMDDLIAKTGLKPKDIDFLIINCSLFSPTPSLAAMVCNKYKLSPVCRTFNLSGQGCSASLISVDLAKTLLSSSPGSNAVVISTENLSQQLYKGSKRSMLLQNTLFRCGGAAILLSNRFSAGFRAKYKLLKTIRVHNSSDTALNAVYQQEDEEGNQGIHLSKEITTIAGKTLAHNLTLLGPHVLPLREQFKAVAVICARWVVRTIKTVAESRGWTSIATSLPVIQTYVPDFKKGIDAWCIHAGGRAVIDGIETNLKLTPEMTRPSRETLRRFGNTSSSSIWYELEYIEESGSDASRIIQLAFGSGFKVNSAVWLRLK